MGQVVERIWRSGPRKVKRTAWGYTVQLHGKQARQFNAAWSKQDAQDALAARILGREIPDAGDMGSLKGTTLGALTAEYVDFKRAKGKRSVIKDEQICRKLTAGLGAETPLTEITAQRIARYDRDRATQISRLGRRLSPSTVNRELAILRHMLQLAKEWGYVVEVPKIRLAKEPEGRIRWLSPDEEARLLAACAASRCRDLAAIVTVALETGLRHGELFGLAWERVDLSRGVIRLEVTKSGKRREVPMRQAVYDVLSARPGPRVGRVFPARSIRTAFENAVDQATLEGFRFHDCRHHFASWFMMQGGQLLALKEILGHASLAMTMRYAHLAPEHLRSEILKTDRKAFFSTTSAHSPEPTTECSLSPRRSSARSEDARVC